MHRLVLALALCLLLGSPAFGQSQAVNGTIEGTVADVSGAVLPGVTVTVTNTDTGASRAVVTNEKGVYRALLLPLGRYKVSAELPGFKTFEQSGHHPLGRPDRRRQRHAGRRRRQRGGVRHGRSADRGARQDRPRPHDQRDRDHEPAARLAQPVQLRLPAGQRHRLREQRVRRAAHQRQRHARCARTTRLDGNTNTEKDRAGLRLLPISEVLVREVKVITNGFAPEFGQTTGMVYNADHAVGHQRPPRVGELPLQAEPLLGAAVLPGVRPPASRTPRRTTSPATLGGPIKKDKLHFFGAYEYVDRSLITGNQVITVKPDGRPGAGDHASRPTGSSRRTRR